MRNDDEEKEMKYTIEELITTFEEHAKKFDIQNEEHAKKYPERSKEHDWDFNISQALVTICREIKRIQRFIYHDFQ